MQNPSWNANSGPALPSRTSRRAFALLYLLTISLFVVMLLGSLLTLSQGQIARSRHLADRSQALLAAEAGVAAVVEKLEEDPSWSAGFHEKALPGGLGTFTAVFAAPSTTSDEICINNLSNAHPVDSYHGASTVPPRSALLIVTGHANTVKKTVEVLLVPGGDVNDGSGIVASGKISLRGDVKIEGVRSLTDSSSVPVNIHSNSEETGTQIAYSPTQPSDSLSVSGTVTSSSSSATPTAISLAGTVSVDDRQSQVPPRKLPHVNIEAILSDHASQPGPPIPTLPGNFSLSGNNYYSGDVVIHGDLVLDTDARIFVTGNLTINGSVRGNGALIVGGDTRLYGDSQVSADRNDYVSILSRGHVVLSGFNGEAYMDSLVSADPVAGEHWEDTRWALDQLQSYLQAHAHLTPGELGARMQADDAMLDSWQSIIARHGVSTDTVGGRTRHSDTSAYFRAQLGSPVDPLSSQAFLARRFQQLDDMFRQCWFGRDGASPRRVNDDLLDNFADWDPSLDGGLFDSAQSWNQITTAHRAEVLNEITMTVQQYDYERLGSADFQGYIFTSGALVVQNDLNLLGTVVVNGDESRPSVTVDGKTYLPGEVAFLGSSKLTYVEEIFRGGVENLNGVGKLDVKRWVSR